MKNQLAPALALDNAFDNSFRLHPNGVPQPGRTLRLSMSRDFSL
jgi:hemoglobin/transferrin/lactoferrin receptor protein